eukprot:785509-Pleurochrysis_carterae.AAC.3
MTSAISSLPNTLVASPISSVRLTLPSAIPDTAVALFCIAAVEAARRHLPLRGHLRLLAEGGCERGSVGALQGARSSCVALLHAHMPIPARGWQTRLQHTRRAACRAS